MSAKKEIRIEQAREISKKYKKDALIIFYFEGDKFGYVSYGKDKLHCERIKNLAEKLFREIQTCGY